MKNKNNLGLIGVGKIGEAVISGIQHSRLSSHYNIYGTTRTEESAKKIRDQYKIPCGTDNQFLAEQCSILLLAVKPQQAEKVLSELAPHLKKEHTLVSLCASISLADLAAWTKNHPGIVRAMPNTPCLVREGMSILCPSKELPDAELQRINEIFSVIGKTAVLEESLMDAATGLSGCGPAYMFLILEALSEAGVKVGLKREMSTLLAAQTMLGSAKLLLERAAHPAALKDEVTTPAGCTIDGLMELESGKLRVTLMRAVVAATERSKRLREQAAK